MGSPLPADIIATPACWLLVFDRQASSRWTSLVAMGRYKHVRAFGYVPDAEAYVFYDVQFGRTLITVARGKGVLRMIGEWCQDADVLSFTPQVKSQKATWVAPLLCTTAVAHLIGLRSGALRPDRLFADCLRNGAILVHGRTQGPHDSHRPDAAAAHEDGAAAADAGVAV